MKIKTIKTRIFKPSENLIKFIEDYLPEIKEETVLLITSKIVALSEGRLVKISGDKEKVELIKKESDFCVRSKYAYITIKDGMVMASAGVDESNAQGNIILLPKDSFVTASKVRNYFIKKYKIKKLAVIITDSRSMPLRKGITGSALGYAGFSALKDYCKSLDIFGRPFKHSIVNVADSLATSAVLCMGEGSERRPLAIIKKVPIEYVDKINRGELLVNIKDDMYGPIFRAKLK